MGRTNPTFRDHLHRFEEEWQHYRRGVRSPHQDHFDELLEKAEGFAAASEYQNPAHAYQAILLSVVLAPENERAELAARVDELEERLDDAKKRRFERFIERKIDDEILS